MNMLKTCGESYHQLVPSFISSKYQNANANYVVEPLKFAYRKKQMQSLVVKANNGERRTFLTLEEAGLVEVSGLSTHERFLCRLTVRHRFKLYTSIVQFNFLKIWHVDLINNAIRIFINQSSNKINTQKIKKNCYDLLYVYENSFNHIPSTQLGSPTSPPLGF